ncbi:hypothetical protein A33Q_3188 [Indibacter alkaliphilus LW1]|uniref:Uncharacterized protein n=1 Tax=Indibacter alkaliphilus (strain CCUG 57479 / KCTC 22604 / LW1) TaxID=1189612 RepID=S2DUP9_INDAL|nr:hypothetical protein A33Q_3188 [Indibacter alkaliphilus LW1]
MIHVYDVFRDILGFLFFSYRFHVREKDCSYKENKFRPFLIAFKVKSTVKKR